MRVNINVRQTWPVSERQRIVTFITVFIYKWHARNENGFHQTWYVSVISHCSQHHKQPRSEVLCGSYRWVNFPGRNGVPKETSGAPSRLHRVITTACPSITAVFVGAQVDHTNTKKRQNSKEQQPTKSTFDHRRKRSSGKSMHSSGCEEIPTRANCLKQWK